MTISMYSIYFVGLAFCISQYKKFNNTFKWIALLFVLTSIAEFFNLYAIHINRIFLGFSSHILECGYIVIFFFLFEDSLKGDRLWQSLRWLYIPTFLFSIYNAFTQVPFYFHPTHVVAVSHLLIITSCFLGLKKMLDFPVEEKIHKQPFFIFLSSALIYHSLVYFDWMIIVYAYLKKLDVEFLGTFNKIACLIYYPIFLFAIWLNSRQQHVRELA